jgi:hypothetical protein
MTKNLIRATYSLIGTLFLLVSFTGVAYAPPCPSGDTERCTIGNFAEGATLDTSQVIDPGPCTLHVIDVDGELWSYCEEDPSNVQPMLD